MKNGYIKYAFLGKLIRYYRVKLGLKQETICGSVTTARTLYRIESGNYCSIKNVYSELSKRIGKTFDETDCQFEQVYRFSADIIFSFKNDHTVNQFKMLRKRIRDAKRIAEGKLYIYELLDLYESYLNCHIEGDHSNKNLYYLIKDCLDFLTGTDYEIALSFLMNYSLEINRSFDDFFYFAEKCRKDGVYINNYDLFRLEMCNDIADVEHRYERVLRDKDNNPCWNSFSYRYCVYSILSFTYNNRLDQKRSLECLELIVSDNEFASKLPRYLCLQVYKRMGIRYFVLNDYLKSYELMLNVHKHDKTVLETNHLFLFKAMEILEKNAELTKIVDSICLDDLDRPLSRTIVRYYKMKYISNETEEKLEDYLVENLFYHLFDNDTFFRDILFEEMHNLVKHTHNYKKLSKYIEKQSC
ncbi:MAG: hypothetical protein IKF46_07255 [Erysipelotrichaceae bacterium]|nr:hypothetical protein [Erysipelotrichaceae bacterium]